MQSRFVQALVEEVRRRRVFRAVVVYAVAAWLVIQVGDVILDRVGFADWLMLALILSAVIGFPLVFLATWCIEFDDKGFRFDLPLWRGLDPDHPRSHGAGDWLVLSSLVFLLGAGTWFGIGSFLDEVELREANKQAEIRAGEPEHNSIAVLSFDNFAGRAEADDFANGLTEEILDLLARINELSVAARTSSFQFRDEQKDIREIARILSVQYVLEGSVSQDGDRVLIRSRLVNGEDGNYDWTSRYERELEDIFRIQQEIARAVVNELSLVLSVEAEERILAQPTNDIEAYMLYVQGRGRLSQTLDGDVMHAAAQLFQDAIDLDPKFARAYAGICSAHLRLYELARSVTDFELAESACTQAMDMDSGLDGEISVALGALYRYRGWYPRAEEQLRIALEINAGDVEAMIELGEVYKAQEMREEAEEWLLRAIEVKRYYWRGHEALSNLYFHTERYPESLDHANIVVQHMPDSAAAWASVGASEWMLGNYEASSEAYAQSIALKPSRLAYTNRGLEFYYAGQFELAAEMQHKALVLAPDDHRVWGRLAESYRFAGDHESDARDAYEEAAKFARGNIDVNNDDWKSQGLLAIYLAHLDEFDDALERAEMSVDLSNRDAEALYYQALVQLEAGDEDASLTSLEESVSKDERYRTFVLDDPDLRLMGGRERFQALLPEEQ